MALLAFGSFVLDTTENRLLRDHRTVEVASMPLAVLAHFVQHAGDGRIVTKEELRKQVWHCKVEDVTIRSCIRTLREVLGDSALRPIYLQTQGKTGWRLLPTVADELTRPHGHLPPPPGGLYDPTHYVPRPTEEKIVLSSLHAPGRAVVVAGPLGSGKRMLIEHTLTSALRGQSAPIGQILRINVRAATELSCTSLDALLREFGRQVLESRGCAEPESRQMLESFWSPPILAKQKLRELLLHLLSPSSTASSPRPTALVFYDVDCLVGSPFQHDVFNMLRAWQEDRFFDALRLVLASNLMPRLFPVGGQSSLWTKVHRVDVSHIGVDQIRQLAERHGVTASDSACVRLGELVGWNVHLCRVALFHAAVYGLSLDEALNRHQPGHQGPDAFSDHLEDVRHELERLAAGGELPTSIGAILGESASSVSLPDQTAWRLLRRGLLCEAGVRNRFQVRCLLYTDHFAHTPGKDRDARSV